MLWGGWGEKKESARGKMGRGKKEERPPRLFPLPIVPRALSIFPLLRHSWSFQLPSKTGTKTRLPLCLLARHMTRDQ